MNRILLIAAVVVSIATAGLGVYNKMTLDSTKQDLLASQADHEKEKTAHGATKTTLATTEESLKTATAAKEKAEEELKVAQTSLEETKTKLATLEEAAKEHDEKVAEINKKLEEATTELAKLREDAENRGGEIADNDKTDEPSQGTSELEEKLEKAEATIANLQGELAAAKAQYETLQADRTARAALAARNDVQGLVKAVNKPWNFVVLNLGDRQGVSQGSEMLIQRGNDFIGRVRVRSVSPADSVADIDVSSIPRGVEIQPGDSVIFKAAR